MKRFLIVTIIVLSLFSCKKNSKIIIEESIRPVKYAEIRKSQGKNVFKFSGVAQSDQEAKLSFRVAGTIRTINVKLGDRVKKGQTIATLDPSDYTIKAEQASASQKGSEANLISAEAQVNSAKTQIVITKATYDRIEKLYENNSVPLSEFESAKAAYETAVSQHDAALSSLDAAKTQVTSSEKQAQSAQNQVEYTQLLAPYAGVITTILVEVNEIIGSGQTIAILNSEDNPEINVGIPENFISRINRGQQVEILFSVLPDQQFEGEILEVSYAAGSSPTYPAIVRIRNASKDIRPGMAATVIFNFNDKEKLNQLVSPVQAVGQDQDGNYVFVISEEDGVFLAQKKTVVVGELLPEGFEIIRGLEEGELVAIAGLQSLLDGMKVNLLDD